MLISCAHCGKDNEINPGSLLGLGKPKTQSQAAISARIANLEKAQAAKMKKREGEHAS